MNQDLERVVEIPQGFELHHKDKDLIVKGNGKEIKRTFSLGKIKLHLKDGKAILSAKKGTRRESKMIGSIEAHLINMFRGLKENFVYKMEICNVHFPMTVKIEGNKFIIKTFLGETVDRIARIMPDTKVEIKGSEVSVSSPNVEFAGQTAANIEIATKIRNRDRRVFQDGIFITSKPL